MRRDEFMRRLEELLADVAEEEKREALEFYRGYFEDAGEENEERIIKELESPEKVARTIKEDLRVGSQRESGEYTEQGYQDSRFEEKQEMGFRQETAEEKEEDSDTVFEHRTGRRRENGSGNSYQNQGSGQTAGDNGRTWKILLIVALAILASPVWIGLAGGLLGGAFGILGGILGIIISGVAVAGAFYISGVAVFGVGIAQIAAGAIGTGLALMGAGLLLLTLAVLATIACVWIFGKLIPWIYHGIVKLCKSAFQGKGRPE